MTDLAVPPPTWRHWLGLPAACLLLAGCALLVDVPVARFCQHGKYPELVGDILGNAEPFGHAAGVVLIAVSVLVLDERGRWLSVALVASAVSGGLAANIGKLLVSRTRPRSCDLWQVTCADTFGDWLPLLSRSAANQSFPSAHTATAVGLAVMLCAAYPRGRWWFVTLAVLVGVHRVESSAHYPSDVLAGAAVGWIAGQCCVAMTARWRARQAVPVAPALHRAA